MVGFRETTHATLIQDAHVRFGWQSCSLIGELKFRLTKVLGPPFLYCRPDILGDDAPRERGSLVPRLHSFVPGWSGNETSAFLF